MNWVILFHNLMGDLYVEEVKLLEVIDFDFSYFFVASGVNIEQFAPYFINNTYKIKFGMIYRNHAMIMNKKYQPPSKKDKVVVGAYFFGPWVIDVLRKIKKDNYVVKSIFIFLIDGECITIK